MLQVRRVLALTLLLAGGAEPSADGEIEADWAAQESRRGRSLDAPGAVRDVLDRAARVLEDLRRLPGAPDTDADARRLDGLRAEAAALDAMAPADRRGLYLRTRGLAREAALRNPLLAGRPLVFLKRRRFACQMLHEYMGYFYDGLSGGGVHVLEEPGRSFRTRDLLGGRLKPGNFTTLALSYDARTVYFAYHPSEAARPDPYRPRPDDRLFHLYSVSADGARLQPLTEGPSDDFDPCPLPDGGLAFLSSRRGGFVRCNNPWEPIVTYTLHRCGADGRDVRPLSFHETDEWHPTVLNDGRLAYVRWDYVDRSASNFHGLWTTHPDGTAAASLFGNYTTRINACYQPRAVPGSRKIAFIAGAHHADVGGALMLLDPDRTALDPATGLDDLAAVERLTPDVPYPEGDGRDGGWPAHYFHSPWPLSENHFLVSYSHDRIPGMSSGGRKDSAGIYYFDRFGTLELLYREEGVSCMYPIPLAPRPVPPVLPSRLDPALRDEGEFVVSDVKRSLFPLPADRPVRELRVFQLLPKSTHVVNAPRLGFANAEPARLLVGTAPVEADGSAYFRAPAGRPLYFQAVDAGGRAVQGMRSAVYLQPGERRSCAGCHEPRRDPPGTGAAPLALQRPPSILSPGPDGSRPMSYARLVQPVLDRHCLRCHGPDGARPLLDGTPAGAFSRSYESLRPFVRWYEWGGQSISGATTRPGRLGADASPLARILHDERHAGLPDPELRRLYLWLDANAPFFGTYGKEEQDAQRRGEAVPVPRLQ